jgi:hypothetical protein
MEREPGKRADDRAVDADELKVAPQQDLELTGGVFGVPVLDCRRDKGFEFVFEGVNNRLGARRKVGRSAREAPDRRVPVRLSRSARRRGGSL